MSAADPLVFGPAYVRQIDSHLDWSGVGPTGLYADSGWCVVCQSHRVHNAGQTCPVCKGES